MPKTSNARATYRVFLSSTSRDLVEYREAVHRAIDGLPGFQLVKLEDFGARDANAKDLCARLVRDCDLFVGVMGHYYGSCPPGEPVSFTEFEYRTATAANLARLMFVAPEDFPILASLRESDVERRDDALGHLDAGADRLCPGHRAAAAHPRAAPGVLPGGGATRNARYSTSAASRR